MFDKDQSDTDDNVTLGSGSRSADEVKVIKQEERGLSDMVKQCLGKPLDKSQRVSDWERRPLRSKQIDYAGEIILLSIRLSQLILFLRDIVSPLSLSCCMVWWNRVLKFTG